MSTAYHSQYLAHALTLKQASGMIGKRCELFDAQDAIDVQRDELIGKIERQMRQRTSVLPIFAIRWEVC